MFGSTMIGLLGGGYTPPPDVDTPNGQGEGIEVLFLRDTWRTGTQDNFIITVPTGYQCNWEIVEASSLIANTPYTVSSPARVAGTPYVAASGNSAGSIAHTFAPTDAMKVFHIHVTVRKGNVLQFQRWFFGAITVHPPLFTRAQANLIINLVSGITYRDNNLIDRTNYKVWVEGVGTSGAYLGLEEWVSSVAYQPVHFLIAPGTVAEIRATGAYAIRINQNCQNILIDGCGDPGIPYGLKLSMPGTGARAQICYIEASTVSGSTPATAGYNIWVRGVESDGNNISSAGWKIDTANSATLNYATVLASPTNQGALKGLNISRVFTQRTNDEIFYGGYVHDSDHSPGFTSCPIIGAFIYDFHTDSSGGDALQLGASMFKPHVFRCTVKNAGTRNDPSHKNMIQFSSGNVDMFFFANITYSGKNLHSVATGEKGNRLYVWGNVLKNPNVDGNNHINTFFRVDQNTAYSSITAQWYSNTYDVFENHPFEAWNATNTPALYPKLHLDYTGNAIVADTLQGVFPQNSIDQSFFVVNNKQVLRANAGTLGFVDFAGGDYRPANLSSALFGARTLPDNPHPLANTDQDGYVYNPDMMTFGAHAGIPLQT